MNNNIDKQLDVNMNRAIRGFIENLAKLNLSVDEVYEHIKMFGEPVRANMCVVAISSNNNDLANKIEIVNKKLAYERINNFIDSVTSETKDEFLASMSFIDKISLKVDIEHSKDLEQSSLDVKKYLEIIDSSIHSDLKKFAKNDGFDSVEAWQRHNAVNADSKPFHARRPKFK